MVFRKQCMYSPFTVEFKSSASPRRKTQDAQILGYALMYNVVRCFYQNRNIHIVSSFRRKWVSCEQWVSCVVIHILCVSLEVIDFLHRKRCGHGRNLHVISGSCELWAGLWWFFLKQQSSLSEMLPVCKMQERHGKLGASPVWLFLPKQTYGTLWQKPLG